MTCKENEIQHRQAPPPCKPSGWGGGTIYMHMLKTLRPCTMRKDSYRVNKIARTDKDYESWITDIFSGDVLQAKKRDFRKKAKFPHFQKIRKSMTGFVQVWKRLNVSWQTLVNLFLENNFWFTTTLAFFSWTDQVKVRWPKELWKRLWNDLRHDVEYGMWKPRFQIQVGVTKNH